MRDFPHDIDLAAFWDSEPGDDIHDEPASAALIAEIEADLGYRLPPSYVAFMQRHNGGRPTLSCCPVDDGTSWSEDHCAIDCFLSIGRRRTYSLGGEFGSRFMIEEWGYPDLGVYICSCPSAGHDMIALDYRACGPEGEPQVVHVDQEGDYRVTFLAQDFASFVRSLVSPEVYDTSEQDFLDDQAMIADAPFSEPLAELLEHFAPVPDLGARIRVISQQILEDKRYFALHADPLSHLLYDLQFWLYQHRHGATGREDYLAAYSALIAFGNGFGTGGYAPGFITDWFQARVDAGQLQEQDGAFVFNPAFTAQLLERLKDFPPATALNEERP